MQAAVPTGTGAMAAILGADDAQILAACEAEAGNQVVAPANYNSPGQLVIAGDAAAVDRVMARLQDEGVRKIVKLAVSVPSHCALMKGAAERLGERFAELSWSEPAIPVIQNADARVAGDVAAIREALQRQLYLPVRWTECVQALVAGGATTVVECGPGKVLTGLVKRIDKSIELRSLAAPADFDAALALARLSHDPGIRRCGPRTNQIFEDASMTQVLKGEIALVTGASRVSVRRLPMSWPARARP